MKQFYKNLTLLLVLSFSFIGFSQDNLLPKGLSEQEKNIVSEFQFKRFGVAEAPSLPIRAAAEWEEVEYLVLGCPSGVSPVQLQIIQAAIQECKVIIASTNTTAIENYLISNQVDMTNIEFVNVPVNSIWIRDYGGNTVYTEEVGKLIFA